MNIEDIKPPKKPRRQWDNEKLELIRQLANKAFPEAPVHTLARMKAIIREQEKLQDEVDKYFKE